MGYSIILGLNTGMDTLISQAAGAKDFEQCGVILNRARFVVTLFFVPLSLMSLYSYEALTFLGISE